MRRTLFSLALVAVPAFSAAAQDSPYYRDAECVKDAITSQFFSHRHEITTTVFTGDDINQLSDGKGIPGVTEARRTGFESNLTGSKEVFYVVEMAADSESDISGMTVLTSGSTTVFTMFNQASQSVVSSGALKLSNFASPDLAVGKMNRFLDKYFSCSF